ncbi:MAG: hypothetical protein EAZ42_09910 [Verrucomicrobia bacterium]|nr:MAG: hypothetical protein EAZ42_09910 [Verrucomicrobiota bacterium]
MTSREKTILKLMAAAGFVVLNFVGFHFYQIETRKIKSNLDLARQNVEKAEVIKASREQISDEMEWLAAHEPSPMADQEVQTQLQRFAENEARSVGLTIKAQKPLTTDTAEGLIYHRVKFEFDVTGTEEALYRWLDRVNEPQQFRIASQILLSPNEQDDTKINCRATIEQWFVPTQNS